MNILTKLLLPWLLSSGPIPLVGVTSIGESPVNPDCQIGGRPSMPSVVSPDIPASCAGKGVMAMGVKVLVRAD